jgi:Ni,Fe-hydrogenase III large subunit
MKNYLSQLDIYNGKIDSLNNEEFKDALEVFYHQENFEERKQKDGYIDKDILEYMRKKGK